MTIRWTDERDELLIKNFNQIPDKKLEILLDSKMQYIRNRMKRLYLNGKLNGRFRKWSEFEDEYILENYGIIPIEEIEMKLFRTKVSIKNRLYRLIGECKQNCLSGNFITSDLMIILGCTKRHVYNLVQRTDIPYTYFDNKYVFDQDEFWEWIKVNEKYIQAKSVCYDDLYFCPEWYKDLVNKLKRELNNKTKSESFTKHEVTLMKNLRNRGYTYAEIGKELNRNPSGIKNKFARLNKEEKVS